MNFFVPSLNPVKLFYSYSHKDEELQIELMKHLAGLRRRGLILEWYDRKISGGKSWEHEIDKHLNTAQVILFLVSSDFMASDYANGVEVKRAMERHESGEARVIPIILRDVHWDGAPFSRLQALPKNAKPIKSWVSTDEAFTDVAKGIERVIEELQFHYGQENANAVTQKPINDQESLESRVQWVLVLSATIDEINRPTAEAIVKHLQMLSGNANLTLLRVDPGSVRLLLQSTRDTYERINRLFKTGDLAHVQGFSIQNLNGPRRILLLPHVEDDPAVLELGQFFYERGVEVELFTLHPYSDDDSPSVNMEAHRWAVKQLQEYASTVDKIIVIIGRKSVGAEWSLLKLQEFVKAIVLADIPRDLIVFYIATASRETESLKAELSLLPFQVLDNNDPNSPTASSLEEFARHSL